MRGPRTGICGRVIALAAGALLALTAAGGGTASPPAPALRQQESSLAARSHRALLDLYSAETRLAQARTRLATLQRQVTRLRGEQLVVRQEVSLAARAHSASQQRLAGRLRALYEQDRPDPVAVILGAASFDDAITRIDSLNRAAAQNRELVRQTSVTRRKLSLLSRTLAARSAALAARERDATATVSALEQARSQRAAVLASLRSKQQFTRREAARIETQAATARAQTQQLLANGRSAPSGEGATSGSSASPAPVPAAGGRTLTVSATGYSLPGRTATGLPVGWGIVAVDPSVIPLGTHMTVPGYGEAVAADTGSAVLGATIDLWFPTLAQARAWGRRTVTIVLH